MAAAFLFNLITMGPSHWRLSKRELGLLELEPLGASYCRCNVNKKQGCLRGKENNKLINVKLPNPVGTEEEN